MLRRAVTKFHAWSGKNLKSTVYNEKWHSKRKEIWYILEQKVTGGKETTVIYVVYGKIEQLNG